MGQYLNGAKIGTCESMYYMRLDEARELAARGARDDDKISFNEYLTDNTTRWRFPWPNEDQMSFEQREKNNENKYDKSFSIPCPASVEVNHEDICVSNAHPGGGYNVNIFLPCPHSPQFKDLGIRTSTGGAGQQFLSVLFQAVRDGKEKTIFACARCGQQQRFSDEDIEKIKQEAREHFACYKKGLPGDNTGLHSYAMQVIDLLQ